MKLIDIMQNLEQFCPHSFSMDWDNSGLQAGNTMNPVDTVMLAVDCTSSVVTQAVEKGAQLILTHHPLVFKGISSVSDMDFVGRRIVRMLENRISCFAMHTNFDVLGMADAAADELRLMDREVLEVTFEDDVSREGLGRIGKLPEYMTLAETAAYVRDAFGVPYVRVYGLADTPVVSCAVLPGSGASEIDIAIKAGADVMITGDITHHKGLDAVEKGIAVIDAGHYGIEKLFVPYMESYLRRELPELTVLRAEETEPCFTV